MVELRQSGRLSANALATIRKYFRIKNIYHSNAIEGNTLDVGETRQVVQYGLTLTGKPLKDQAEAKNLAEAIDYLEDLVSSSQNAITAIDIRQLHTLVLKDIDDENAGRYRSIEVKISGSSHKPPAPGNVPVMMDDFCSWLQQASVPQADRGDREGLINAAVAHTWFVDIHPFVDGNGRVARLLMNLILMRYGYPIAVITREDRLRYYDALEISQGGNLSAFIALLSESLHESLEEYERAVQSQQEQEEWAQSLAGMLDHRPEVKAANEYEVWKSAMDLLKGHFRQIIDLINEGAQFGKGYFKDFGSLEKEKYLSLRLGESAKKTWFFRIDFKSGERVARYLFFFGFPSYQMKPETEVTLHVAREDPPNSFTYERLTNLTGTDIPSLVEIGYKASEERFVALEKNGQLHSGRIEEIGRKFFEQVIQIHFQ